MKRKGLHRSRPPKRIRYEFDGPMHIERIHAGLELLSKGPGKMDPETADRIVNLQMEEIRKQDKACKFSNSVSDLIEIQTKFEELHATIDKEKARLAVVYSYPESLNDELKAILKAKMCEKTAAVEASYHKLCEQLYSKRFQIVNGLVPAKNAHIHEAMRSSFKDKLTNEAMKSAFEDTTENKGVPNFWLTVMKVKPVLRQQINGHDEEVLKFLKDIKVCQVDKRVGLKLEFYFAENPFFRNQILTKTYYRVNPEVQMPWDSVGTIIEWYGGKRQRLAGHGSFFDYFASLSINPYVSWRFLDRDNAMRCALEDIIHRVISYYVEKKASVPDEVGGDNVWSSESEEEKDDESLYEFDFQIGHV